MKIEAKKYFLFMIIFVFMLIISSTSMSINNKTNEREEVKFRTDFSSEREIDLFKFVPDFENYFRNFQLEENVDLATQKEDYVLEIKEIGPLLNNPRRPRTYALVKDHYWKEAKINLKFRYYASEGTPDIVIPFAYQNPNEWYYIHISEKSDSVHNVIMKIKGTERYTIHTQRNRAPLKTKNYYEAEIYLDTEAGRIEVYVNGEEEPILVGEDNEMKPGLVGIGSFDTYAYFKYLEIEGKTYNSK